VFGPDRDLLEVVANHTRFFAHESCGFCTPCRVGTRLQRDIVSKFQRGEGTSDDLAQLRALTQLMKGTSHCGLGQTAGNTVVDTLKDFAEMYRLRISGA
jgi:[NiFe] hydrogenase diaphorase moiety large subunit